MIALGVNYSLETLAPDLHPVRKKRLYSSHMSLENALRMLKANDLSKVRELHLLHLSNDNSNGDMFKDRIERATGIPTYLPGG